MSRPPPELGIEPGDCDPDVFVNAWVGTRFKFDGRDRNGVDCWGLVWRFYRDCLGEILPDWSKGENGAQWVADTIDRETSTHWVDLDDGADLCLVVASPAGRPAHIGVSWRGGVLHASLGRGVVWEKLAAFRKTYPHIRFGLYCESPPL